MQADLLTLASLGCHPLSVVTAITIQDTIGVEDMLPIDADWVVDQARCVLEDVPVDAFKVGGGILLFLLAVEMVFARPSGVRSITAGEDEEAHNRADISVFPLSFPLIAGPGALATILLAFAGVPLGSVQFFAQIGVILLVLGITLILMLASGPVMRVIGVTGGAVLSRLTGVLLAALAVQFVMDGIVGALALS